jgi:hypothetical protein
MEKKISTERLYALGNYQNIKLIDEITGIPDEVSNNSEAMKLLRYFQLLELEYSYSRYMLLEEKLYGQKMPMEEILETLEKERTIVFADLINAMGQKGE